MDASGAAAGAGGGSVGVVSRWGVPRGIIRKATTPAAATAPAMAGSIHDLLDACFGSMGAGLGVAAGVTFGAGAATAALATSRFFVLCRTARSAACWAE
jgi:hypothetical protein